ncbi:MAG TPA: helix-turn-helix transcriptional regulator [Stellaceae bacterium]|nr:helix-turn-helix transcriptional regulator [Stellaceae bacterium]
MQTRGRPPKKTGAPRYANRLRELRHRLGLSQQEVAQQAAISAAYCGALERGDKRINADTAQRLHRPLRCAVSDLLSGTQGVSVPLRFAIAAAECATRPDRFDLPEPQEMLHPGRVGEPQDCLAAEIFDDSADLDLLPAPSFSCARWRCSASLCAPAPGSWPGSFWSQAGATPSGRPMKFSMVSSIRMFSAISS